MEMKLENVFCAGVAVFNELFCLVVFAELPD